MTRRSKDDMSLDSLKKTVLCVTIFFCCILNTGFFDRVIAGVTGTLAGTVTNKDNGEPLIGANIVILGTNFGTIVDPKGFFLINNVPPGIYKVRASMMGFVAETRENVRISIDLRTTLDFTLSSTVLEFEEITVSAEQPLIQKDITSSTHFVSSHDLNHKPVRSFHEVVDIQPGVAGGHFRGGRKSEVIYLVDGIPIQEAIEGEAGSEIPQNAITEVSIQTGGFNAEYGRAMSGVVNVVTKEGGSKHHGQLSIYSDRLTGHHNYFKDRPVDDENYGELFLGGPVNHKASYLLSWNIQYPFARWRRDVLGYKSQVFADPDTKKQSGLGKISYRLSDALKLNVQGLISMWDWTEYEHWWYYWKENLDGLPPQSKKSYQVATILTHTLNPHTFYTVKLSQFFVLKSVFGKGTFEYDFPSQDTDGEWRISEDKMWWQDHKEVITTAKVEGTSQITPHHQVKSGFEFIYYYLYLKDVKHDTTETSDWRFPQYNIYDTEYHYYPKEGSIYLQDKIEYLGLVANLGLRYDFFNPTASRPAVEQDTTIQGDEGGFVITNDKRVPASFKQQISPRLGVSIAIYEDLQIHLNYGYFFQIPSFKYLYTNLQYNAEGFSPLAGDPDLKPAQTIAFEAGLKYRFLENYLFNITLFNKDVSNLIDTKTYLPQNEEGQGGYTQYVNVAHVNIHGEEMYLEKRYGKFITGRISYTYMMAQGTGSSGREGYDWLSKGYQVPIGEYFLSWDQRHKLVLDLDVRKEDDWGISLLWQWNSPLPYTKDTGYYTKPNDARMESTDYLDLKINKDFSFDKIRISFLLELRNALDSKNILWLDSQGIPGGALNDPGAYDLGRRIRLGMDLRF